MQLKTVPEDFVVVELSDREPAADGPYLLLELAKRNITTERALSELAAALDVPRKAIGYCGTKDARALTRQRITVRAPQSAKERLTHLKRGSWSVRVLGHTHEPLGLGMLAGNRFELVARAIAPDEVAQPLASYPNYFDEQRFSTANSRIGRLILQGEYTAAAELVISTDPATADRMREHLENRPNDGVSALRLAPKHTLLMYVHSYQSLLFNEVLSRWIAQEDVDAQLIEGAVPIRIPSRELPDIAIPIVGFGSELVEPFAQWYEELLNADNLIPRDFVIRALPFLTAEGTARRAVVPIRDLEIGPREPDELNPGLEKQRVTFSLPKGAYATLAIKCLYRVGDVRGSTSVSP